MSEGHFPYSSTFSGRRRELAALGAALTDARSGRGRFVLLVGDAGIGKTRLAEELAATADGEGVLVLWGRCPEDEGAPPYWPWTQTLRMLQRRAPEPSAMAEAEDAAATSSARSGPGRPGLVDAEGDTPESARFRYFAAVSAELRAAARSTAMLIVLEDLHWADASTLQLLEFIARELAGTRIMILGTARDRDPARHESVTEALARAPLRTIPLAGLDEQEIRRLLEQTGHPPPSPHLLHLIHEHTEGNPFFVLEIANWLEHEGAPDAARHDVSLPIPDSVRAVLTRRLDRLADGARAALRKAAVLSGEFSCRLLADLEDAAVEDELRTALEDATRADLIRNAAGEVAGEERYRFRHALIRQALYEELPAGDRRVLHARIADVLEAMYGAAAQEHAAELTHHLARAGDLASPDRLVACARIAGEQALGAHAYAEAGRHFERALAVRGSGPCDAEFAALSFGLGRARAATSPRWNRQDAWGHLRRAIDCYLELDDVAHAVAAATHPSITPEGATGIADSLERLLERVEPDSPAAGLLLARQGACLFFERGEYDLARAAFGRALTVARRTGEAALELRTLAYATAVDHFAFRWPQVLDSSRRVIALAREVDDPHAENYARYRASFALVFGGRAAEGRVQARTNLERAEQLGDEGLLLDALYINTALAQLQGDWDAARSTAERGLGLAPLHQPLLHLRTLLELERGRQDAAMQFVDRLLDAARHAGPYPLRDAFRALVLPQAAHIAGDTRPLEALETDTLGGGVAGTMVAVGRALAAVQRRDARAAAAELRRLEPLSGSIAAPLLVTDRLLGLIAHTVGHGDQAVAYLESARTFCREAGYLPELGWASHDLAHVLLERKHEGDAERAASLLDEAIDIAASLDMHPLAARATALRGRHQARATNAHRLTPREREVLSLVADGRTNEQIAAELSISANTVAVHVTRILAKTGSNNRTEAARYALREGKS